MEGLSGVDFDLSTPIGANFQEFRKIFRHKSRGVATNAVAIVKIRQFRAHCPSPAA
jgi:hypothetical protein